MPTFLLGIFVFIFIILMFQFLKLTELILAHNVHIAKVLLLLTNMSIGFLPIILPMSLLFSILLTYSRLSADSEMVALKALGYSPRFLAAPAILFSIIISILSAQTLFFLGPSARLQVDAVINQIRNQKVISAIQEGTFLDSESFFDLVLYTNHIDKEKNTLHDLFIYDQRNKENPVAIVAKQGMIKTQTTDSQQSASILLSNGNMYKLGDESHTKVKFDTYNLSIASQIGSASHEKDSDAYTRLELEEKLNDPSISTEKYIELSSEYHGRWAIAFSCLLFGFLGSAVGSRTNRRSNASSGFILSIICIISYWILYVLANTFAKKMIGPPMLLLWTPNFIFLLITLWAWNKHARD